MDVGARPARGEAGAVSRNGSGFPVSGCQLDETRAVMVEAPRSPRRVWCDRALALMAAREAAAGLGERARRAVSRRIFELCARRVEDRRRFYESAAGMRIFPGACVSLMVMEGGAR